MSHPRSSGRSCASLRPAVDVAIWPPESAVLAGELNDALRKAVYDRAARAIVGGQITARLASPIWALSSVARTPDLSSSRSSAVAGASEGGQATPPQRCATGP
jgi:hypothetical protein